MSDDRIDLAEMRAAAESYDGFGFPISGEEVLALIAAVETAHRADEIYEGLRTDENDGEFALWSEDQLVAALHALRPALRRFDFDGAA